MIEVDWKGLVFGKCRLLAMFEVVVYGSSSFIKLESEGWVVGKEGLKVVDGELWGERLVHCVVACVMAEIYEWSIVKSFVWDISVNDALSILVELEEGE